MADTKTTALAAQTAPVLSDLLYAVDDPGGTPLSVSITKELAGGLFWNGLPGGRLTLETGVPVSTSDQTAKTTIYYTPYIHDKIALFNGTAWELMSFSEISIAVPASTTQMYDIWAYDNAGSVALEVLAWTNDTTRATALAYQDGVLCKIGALTRRYLGSFRTTGVSGQTEDSESNRFLWNYYNRLRRKLVLEDTTIHVYATGAWRAWNNDTSVRVNLICGVAEESVSVSIVGEFTLGADKMIGVGLDVVTSTLSSLVRQASISLMRLGSSSFVVIADGFHYLQIVELGSASASFRKVDFEVIIKG